MSASLSLQGLQAAYGRAKVLFDVSFDLQEGQITVGGQRVDKLPSHRIARHGLAPLIRLKQEGLWQIVIDKNIGHLLGLADRPVVIEKGRLVWHAGAARPNPAHPTGTEGAVGQVVGHRVPPLRTLWRRCPGPHGWPFEPPLLGGFVSCNNFSFTARVGAPLPACGNEQKDGTVGATLRHQPIPVAARSRRARRARRDPDFGRLAAHSCQERWPCPI
jgi:hypothetical protein